MKKSILIALFAITTMSSTSCLKSYQCDCAAGTTLKVSTTDEASARQMCEDQSNGRCTL